MTASNMAPGVNQNHEVTLADFENTAVIVSAEQTAQTCSAQHSAEQDPDIIMGDEELEVPPGNCMSPGHAAQKKETSKEPTTFLTLPRELRDMIYELATLYVEARPKLRGLPVLETASEQTKNAAAELNCGLLLASKQIRLESMDPYLRNTLFTFQNAISAVG